MNCTRINKPLPLNAFTSVLDDLFNKGFNELANSHIANSRPNVNILETDDAFNIELAAPGLTKEDFEIKIDKHQLTIKVSNQEESEDKDKGPKYRRREFNFSSFTRSFHLPRTVNKDAIDANYENGVLILTLNKKEEAKDKEPRTITIS